MTLRSIVTGEELELDFTPLDEEDTEETERPEWLDKYLAQLQEVA
jgi:hypothetical protein